MVRYDCLLIAIASIADYTGPDPAGVQRLTHLPVNELLLLQEAGG